MNCWRSVVWRWSWIIPGQLGIWKPRCPCLLSMEACHFYSNFGRLTLPPSPAYVLDTFDILHHACFRPVGIKMLWLLFLKKYYWFTIIQIIYLDQIVPTPLFLLIHPFQVPFSSTTSHSSFVCLFDAMLRLIRVVCISVWLFIWARVAFQRLPPASSIESL